MCVCLSIVCCSLRSSRNDCISVCRWGMLFCGFCVEIGVVELSVCF